MCRTRSNRTEHGTADWFKIGKEACQSCILSPCLFNLYIEYIKQNTRLDDSQAEIKICGRIINNLRYTDDTTLKAESKEKLKSLLMMVKEESEKVDLKLNIQKISHFQSFPASGSFPMSQFFTSGGQSIGVSVLASVLPMNIQD